LANAADYRLMNALMSVLQSRLSRGRCLVIAWATLLAACLVTGESMLAQGGGSVTSTATADRLKAAGWWPTKRDTAREEYVGAAACAECHGSEVGTAARSAMAHAATRAAESESLQQAPLAFQIGSYRYQISDDSGKKVLKISKGGASRSTNLMWAFGMGRIAQTYVYEQNGNFYESHLSFYTSIQALDVTPGHPRTEPPSLAEGLGRRIPVEERLRCFGCHTTASTTKERLDTRTLFPGVTCEACHGPGARHVAAMKSGDIDLALRSIVNPARLSAGDSVEFCGACHRTWQDVVSDGPVRIGTLNVRFQPYRLENSKCWKEGDARITCVACHDPHQPLVRDPASYDAKCLQCHKAAGDSSVTTAAKSDEESTGKSTETAAETTAPIKKSDSGEDHRTACPIGVQLCVTCHMPKFKNQTIHATFTDHWIRIAAPGAPLPN
jgi:Cytochrome c554 and c-prime